MDERTTQRLARLASQAKRSQERFRTDVAIRDDAIGEADAAGFGVREIARATELTPAHVHRIIIAKTIDRQNPAL